MNCRLPALREKTAKLTTSPGVYLMKNQKSEIIYVGKAKNLKNRVTSYFRESADHTPKVDSMVEHVYDYDFIVTDSEYEALVLECSLIKQHQPKYNILLKDDKGYPYIRLTVKEPYPRFSLANRAAEDGARYFGPYGSRGSTQNIIDALRVALKLPSCSRKFPRDIGKERPCLNYHMGQCDGYCRKEMDQTRYREAIDQAVRLLEGQFKEVGEELLAEMEQAAEELRFEKAAELRDRFKAIELLGKRQKVIAGICADTDIWGVYRGALKCGSAVLHIEDGSVTGRDLNLFAAPQDESEQMILSALLPQYYLNKSVLPREILLPCEIEGAAELAQILTERAGRKVTLHVPQRGEKAELLAMAQRNAREDVERVTTAQERENRTLTQLAGMLSLSEPPERMESYDISNTGASDIVASMVVYEGAKPKKSAYRRFKIKSLSAHPDDYASMEEVLTRRIQRYLDGDEKFSPLPDVMLIDGGITHAGVAERVCAQMHVHVPIFGMVKDDRHRTRALVTAQGREIDLHAAPNVFALIGQIQEETHRFAITFHHESHSRSSTRSALDGIPGVGKVRAQALLKTFKSVKAIREADIFALERVLPKDAAASVYLHFHGETDEKKDEM